jgi:Cys-tRNA synthase (O-phospho-L-seryl-tRNA:Cys-tRNA synthase)
LAPAILITTRDWDFDFVEGCLFIMLASMTKPVGQKLSMWKFFRDYILRNADLADWHRLNVRFRVCSEYAVCGIVLMMSANEVLEQVKALPPRERRKFFACVHELETTIDSKLNGKRKRRVRWPDAAARRRRIFGDRILPNLVLLAREQERY